MAWQGADAAIGGVLGKSLATFPEYSLELTGREEGMNMTIAALGQTRATRT